MGVTVLSFEIEVTGAVLQPSDSSKQPVSMLSEPEDIELEHLQTESALLASKSVPTGTYNSLMVSFANPRMTIQNQTGSPLTLVSAAGAWRRKLHQANRGGDGKVGRLDRSVDVEVHF